MMLATYFNSLIRFNTVYKPIFPVFSAAGTLSTSYSAILPVSVEKAADQLK